MDARPETPCGATQDGWQSRSVTIVNRRGLHARAAVKISQLAARFDAEIMVSRKDVTVPANSIMGLMMLSAMPGSDLEIKARGLMASEALDALARLVASRFDEDV